MRKIYMDKPISEHTNNHHITSIFPIWLVLPKARQHEN